MPTYSFLPFLQNVPIGTRILTGTLVIFSLLHQVFSHVGPYAQASSVSNLVRGALGNDGAAQKGGAYQGLGDEFQTGDGIGLRVAPYLVVIAGKALWFPWTFLTAGWVETNIIQVSQKANHTIDPVIIWMSPLPVHHLRYRPPSCSKVPGARMGTSRAHSVQRDRHCGIKYHSLWP